MSAQVLDTPPPADAGLEFWQGHSALTRWLSRAGVAAPLLVIFGVALWSRLRYAVWSYHFTFGSGDADLILAKAMFLSRGELRPPLDLGAPANVFADPPFISMIFAVATKVFGIPLATAPLIVTPALTIAALFALYALVRRAVDAPVALVSVCLVALLPRFSFDSTEPDKAPFVVSFFIIALWLMYEAQERPRLYLLSGFFMGLSVFSHNTGYLFLPVFVLSHIALSRGSTRRLFDPWFLAGLAIPVLFIGAYLQLNDAFVRGRYVPEPPVAAAPAPSTSPADGATALPPPAAPGGNQRRYVPATIQFYWDHVTGLARDHFKNSAWNYYFDAIRAQVSTPVYVLAIIGWAGAGGLALLRRRYRLVPLMLWMMIVTLEFAIQFPGYSHRSRYPSYVTPVFVIMAVAAIIAATRWLAGRIDTDVASRAWYGLGIAAPLIAFTAMSYALSDNPGLRRNYGASRQMAEYIADNRLLDNGDMLYLGWPSVTLYTLQDRPEYETKMHAFGWGSVPLSSFTPAYLSAHNVRYYAYDHTGSDYFRSADALRTQLQASYTLVKARVFCGPGIASPRDESACGDFYTILYELAPKAG